MRHTRFLLVLPLTLGLLTGVAVLSNAAMAAGGHRTAAKPPGNPTATPAPTATALPCDTCPAMYVDSVNINAWYDNISRTLEAGCFVTVKDEAGNWVEGASVTVQWGGQLSGTATAVTALTGEGGYAEAYFFKSVGGRCRSGDVKISTCTVTNVNKDGMAYDPARNVQNTDSNDHCSLN